MRILGMPKEQAKTLIILAFAITFLINSCQTCNEIQKNLNEIERLKYENARLKGETGTTRLPFQ